MHELAICQALMTQVEQIAAGHNARQVSSIIIGIGPLSGVEEQLLQHAWPVASAGSIAEGAALTIEPLPLTVKCSQCGKESEAKPNKLLCKHCGDWRTQVSSGDELLLLRLELEKRENNE